MPTVILGNVAPCQPVYPDVEAAAKGLYEKKRLDLAASETAFSVPSSDGLIEALTTITRTFDAMHSEKPPAWVECDETPALAAVLSEHYGCPVGRPADWKPPASSSVVPPKKEHEARAAPPSAAAGDGKGDE